MVTRMAIPTIVATAMITIITGSSIPFPLSSDFTGSLTGVVGVSYFTVVSTEGGILFTVVFWNWVGCVLVDNRVVKMVESRAVLVGVVGNAV